MVNDLTEKFKISDYACTQERTFRAGCTLFCNSCLLNFAKEELSDHDSENCSDIRRVTWLMICPKSSRFLTMRARKNARFRPCSVNPVCSISQKDNCPIMIPKTVLITGG